MCVLCLFRCNEAATSNLARLQMAPAFVMFGIKSLSSTVVNFKCNYPFFFFVAFRAIAPTIKHLQGRQPKPPTLDSLLRASVPPFFTGTLSSACFPLLLLGSSPPPARPGLPSLFNFPLLRWNISAGTQRVQHLSQCEVCSMGGASCKGCQQSYSLTARVYLFISALSDPRIRAEHPRRPLQAMSACTAYTCKCTVCAYVAATCQLHTRNTEKAQ